MVEARTALRNEIWPVVLILASIHAAAFTIDCMDAAIEVRDYPDCDWYCGRIPYLVAIFMPFFHAATWLATVVVSLLTLRTAGGSRRAGMAGLAVCVATMGFFVVQATTHMLTR